MLIIITITATIVWKMFFCARLCAKYFTQLIHLTLSAASLSIDWEAEAFFSPAAEWWDPVLSVDLEILVVVKEMTGSLSPSEWGRLSGSEVSQLTCLLCSPGQVEPPFSCMTSI